MQDEHKLSNHCVISHFEVIRLGGPKPPFTPSTLLRLSLMSLDRKMHFTGLRGGIWRLLGVARSLKNPNLCNI